MREKEVRMMAKLYTVTMNDGNIFGVPAEVIAENCAKDYASIGGYYQTEFDRMMKYFDTKDDEFADWAKNNMDWDDVKDKAIFLGRAEVYNDYQDGWENGKHEYLNRIADEGE